MHVWKQIIALFETGIPPLINTGIAHKEPGVGQIGAGTVRAPLGCFEKRLLLLLKELGIDINLVFLTTMAAIKGHYANSSTSNQPAYH